MEMDDGVLVLYIDGDLLSENSNRKEM